MDSTTSPSNEHGETNDGVVTLSLGGGDHPGGKNLACCVEEECRKEVFRVWKQGHVPPAFRGHG